jgi:hypothetical protein
MCYGLHGRGSIPARGKRLSSTAFEPALEPAQPLVQGALGALFPGVEEEGI